ncbi:MAG TPA: protein translocase subunit SecF [Gemmatimonadota bacterium]|nr:protein translocase subunit SecF [Gemmatimonadota bacterium]
MIWLFRDANYPFMEYRRWGYILSGVLILATVILIAARGGLEYSIDFTGGSLVQLDFEQPIEAQTLRSALAEMPGLESSEVQHFGNPTDVVVRAQVPPGEEEEFARRIEAHLRQTPALEGRSFSVVRSEAVGPKIGQELKRDAIMAILYAMGFILVYVAVRFDFKFGVAAILATAHDIVLSVGVFSMTGKEISLAVVAAFLTIVGYSLNDTIVVFDRIREDLKSTRREPFVEIVNRAVNRTLSRTILTGGMTLVVLFFLFFMGGEVIHDFAFALIVGILIGTYSSIFVGAPLVIEWKHHIEDRREAAAPRKPSRKRKQPA